MIQLVSIVFFLSYACATQDLRLPEDGTRMLRNIREATNRTNAQLRTNDEKAEQDSFWYGIFFIFPGRTEGAEENSGRERWFLQVLILVKIKCRLPEIPILLFRQLYVSVVQYST